jgi:hypothetical protein
VHAFLPLFVGTSPTEDIGVDVLLVEQDDFIVRLPVLCHGHRRPWRISRSACVGIGVVFGHSGNSDQVLERLGENGIALRTYSTGIDGLDDALECTVVLGTRPIDTRRGQRCQQMLEVRALMV